jgi:hypothetical protein
MMNPFKKWWNAFTGREEASVAVPVMDGKLKPNRAIDEADVVCELDGLDDLCIQGNDIAVTAGSTVYLIEAEQPRPVYQAGASITAIASPKSGAWVIAVDGKELQFLQSDGGEWTLSNRWTPSEEWGCEAINAIHCEGDSVLWFTNGGSLQSSADWKVDLMSLGTSGMVIRLDFATGDAHKVAEGLPYAFGVCAQQGDALVSASWGHRVRQLSGSNMHPFTAELPAYPSRLSRSSSGGYWLSCFAVRTQLIEFVLREPAYRRRMMQEIPMDYWIAPALSSGHDFLEPLQGAGVKQMGVLKPWAPPRSYGLVIELDAQGHILRSLHSLVDGENHGITSVQQNGTSLWLVAKGRNRLLKVDLSQGVSNE